MSLQQLPTKADRARQDELGALISKELKTRLDGSPVTPDAIKAALVEIIKSLDLPERSIFWDDDALDGKGAVVFNCPMDLLRRQIN